MLYVVHITKELVQIKLYVNFSEDCGVPGGLLVAFLVMQKSTCLVNDTKVHLVIGTVFSIFIFNPPKLFFIVKDVNVDCSRQCTVTAKPFSTQPHDTCFNVLTVVTADVHNLERFLLYEPLLRASSVPSHPLPHPPLFGFFFFSFPLGNKDFFYKVAALYCSPLFSYHLPSVTAQLGTD